MKEALGVLLLKVKSLVKISGFEGRRNGGTITHLQLADDIILSSLAIGEEVATLKQILRCFQLSGVKGKSVKSVWVGVGCSEEVTKSIADGVYCREGRLPIMYLGLPIGGKPRSKALCGRQWDPILRKWRRNCLYGRELFGRMILIKVSFVKSSILLNVSFQDARVAGNKIHWIRRDFLWEGQSK